MKKKVLALLALSTAILLSGCSAKSASSMDSSAPMAPSAMPESAVTTTTKGEADEAFDYASADTPQFEDGVKLVYNGYMSLETTDFDSVAQSLSDLMGEYGGYFSNSSVYQRGAGYRCGQYTVRIPAEKYDLFHQSVGELCLVTEDQTTVDDISAVYYDTQGRLETQQIKLDRLQSLLEQATNMEDLITIESAISETQWQIDNLSGEMNHYDAIVDYATIEISLYEVYQLSNVQDAPKTFGARLGNSVIDGTSNFISGLENFAIGLAYNWATIIVIMIAVVAIVKVRPQMKRIKIFKKKTSAPDDTAE